MKIQTKITPHTLRFKQPAGTSRGVYHEHNVWYVEVRDVQNPAHYGVGECAPLPGLSCDYSDDYEEKLRYFCRRLEQDGCLNEEDLKLYPSILFGLETALRHLQRGGFGLWETPFSKGEKGILINGLIWMGDYDAMYRQIEEKIREGFRCIKLKIGAIDFEKEINLLQYIRSHFSKDKIELRVDANGAFSLQDAGYKLNRLAELDLHSIEQPIRAGQWQAMAELCEKTPLPIALDEELIGICQRDEKIKLLETVKPQFIVLKPTLHGGISGAAEWIELAEKYDIGWWITSALESNIGLNAIAQWCAMFNNPLPQGLGTGSLYLNNVEIPLVVERDCLWFKPQGEFMSDFNL